ncbi:MAG: zinc protease, partial [Rhizobacter sp.]|nr:zinc protease [Rhizobacter sp.]
AREPITDEEFKRAQAKWLKSWDLAFTNPERVGVSLSESVAQGDWRLFFLTRDRVKNLKLADVQRVAETYLVQSNRTLGTYLPTEKPLRAASLAKVDVAAALADFKGEAAAAATEAFEATPANIEARTEKFAVGGVQAALLPKGTRGGVVRASLTLRFGDEKSLFGQTEVAEMVGSLLDKGTKTMTRQQIQDHLDALQTEMRIRGTAGRVSVSLSSRRDQLPAAIALVGDLLRNATFPPEALDELKRQSLAGLEQQRKEPDALVENAIDRLGSPYPRGDVRYTETFEESEQEIAAVTVEKVRAFHQQFYGASKGEFAATGDMDVAAVKAALQSAFGDWTGGMPFTRVPQPLVAVPPERFILKTPDKQNAMMLVRLPVALTDNDADYPALMMANYLLGSGGNSRFWKRIRENEGLSYDVRSNVSWNSHEPNSSWQASAIFAPQNRPKVEAAFKEEIARAQKDGFTQQELDEGRRGLLSFRGLSRAQDATVAAALANNLYLGRTFMVSAKVDEALAGLTLDQVNDALRKYLNVDRFVMGFGGDFKE